MKKSDLVSGKHILETRMGDRFLVAGDFLFCQVFSWEMWYNKG